MALRCCGSHRQARLFRAERPTAALRRRDASTRTRTPGRASTSPKQRMRPSQNQPQWATRSVPVASSSSSSASPGIPPSATRRGARRQPKPPARAVPSPPLHSTQPPMRCVFACMQCNATHSLDHRRVFFLCFPASGTVKRRARFACPWSAGPTTAVADGARPAWIVRMNACHGMPMHSGGGGKAGKGWLGRLCQHCGGRSVFLRIKAQDEVCRFCSSHALAGSTVWLPACRRWARPARIRQSSVNAEPPKAMPICGRHFEILVGLDQATANCPGPRVHC